MKKLPLLLLCTLPLLQTACNGCQPHGATTRNHGKGCNLTLKAVKEAGTINGYPVYSISGKLENDHTAPKETIVGAIFDPTTDKTGKSIAVKDIAEKEPQTPKTNQKGQKSVLAQANEVVKLEQHTLVSYEGAKERVVRKGDVHFIASFVGKDTLQPNTKYAIDLFAAEPRRATGARNAVYTSTQSGQCTTPDFSENASRKVSVTEAKRDENKYKTTFQCKAAGESLPENGVAFFLLVKKCSDNLKQDVFKALERLILNDHKLSDGTELKSLPAAEFKLIDPAQPTEGALYPLGDTAPGGNKDLVDTTLDMEDKNSQIPKDGGKYWATVLVYEPEGKYTVSTDECTVEVPEATADLSVEEVGIAELIVDVSDKAAAAIQSFQLGVKGSMRNPKGIVKPRFYFVFHKSEDPTASGEELKKIVNTAQVTAQANNLDVIYYCTDNLKDITKATWTVLAIQDSAAGDTDETVDRTKKNALNDPKIPLALGETYQVYFAIKDNKGTGGTTLVSETSAKLNIPNVAIAFRDIDAKNEKRIDKDLDRHTILTKASITGATFLEGAKQGTLFVENGQEVTQSDMQCIAKRWERTQDQINKKVKDEDIKPRKGERFRIDEHKVYERHGEIQNLPTVYTTLGKDNYDPPDDAEDLRSFKPQTTYFPAFWLWKGTSIFYASAPDKTFTTGAPFPDTTHGSKKLRYNDQIYFYDHLNKEFFVQNSNGDRIKMGTKKDAPTIREVLGKLDKENIDRIVEGLKLQ